MHSDSFSMPTDGKKGKGKRKRTSEEMEETETSIKGLELPADDVVESTQRPKRTKVKNDTIQKESCNGLPVDEQNRTDNLEGNQNLLNQDLQWPESLSDAQLDLLVSIKKLAVERLTTINVRKLEGLLPASALRTIGILLEELAKHRARSLKLNR